MFSNSFFKKKKIYLHQTFPKLKDKPNFIISGVKPLNKAKKYDVTFFDSIKYKVMLKILKQAFVLLLKN